MPEEPSREDLQALAIDAFRLFGSDPERWPNEIRINRNGLVEANINGSWLFEDRTEFFFVPLDERNLPGTESLGTEPDSSGSSE